MIIPYQQLSPEALKGLMEEFITREGTDYGHETPSLVQKVAQVERQLAAGDVVIVFEPATESVSLVTRHKAEQMADS